MWPFSNRGPRLDVEEALKKRRSDFDFVPFEKNDASIKLWLPEKIITSLDVLSVAQGVSRPDVLRWIFFEHAYGRELFAELKKHQERQREAAMAALEQMKLSPRQHPEALYSGARGERSVNMEFLGKSTEDIKLHLPALLKSELKALAAERKSGLSDYLRAVLARHLFGEGFYLEWQQALEEVNKQAHQHEAA